MSVQDFRYKSGSRQSGRTYRMIERANELAARGRSVVVIAANKHDAMRLRGLVSPGVDVLPLSQIGAAPGGDDVLVDHLAAEMRIADLLRQARIWAALAATWNQNCG